MLARAVDVLHGFFPQKFGVWPYTSVNKVHMVRIRVMKHSKMNC